MRARAVRCERRGSSTHRPELGRIDLKQSDALAVGERERVAVVHGGNLAAGVWPGEGEMGCHESDGCNRECGEKMLHRERSLIARPRRSMTRLGQSPGPAGATPPLPPVRQRLDYGHSETVEPAPTAAVPVALGWTFCRQKNPRGRATRACDHLPRKHAADHRAPRDRADNAVGGGAHGGLETAHPVIGAWTEDAVDQHRGRLTA